MRASRLPGTRCTATPCAASPSKKARTFAEPGSRPCFGPTHVSNRSPSTISIGGRGARAFHHAMNASVRASPSGERCRSVTTTAPAGTATSSTGTEPAGRRTALTSPRPRPPRARRRRSRGPGASPRGPSGRSSRSSAVCERWPPVATSAARRCATSASRRTSRSGRTSTCTSAVRCQRPSWGKEILGGERGGVTRQRDGALHRVLQLPHVPGPGVALQHLHRRA